jgi:hypothetical protein
LFRLRYFIRGILVLVFFLILGAGMSRPALACEPEGDYWFVEVFGYQVEGLPEVIRIETSDEYKTRGFLVIINDSDSPVYVLPREAHSQIVVTEEPTGVEANMVEEDRVIEEQILFDKAPELAVFTIPSNKPLTLSIDGLMEIDIRLEDHNVFDYTRPAFVVLPPNIRSEMYLVHEEAFYEVTFTVTYLLNENYSPRDCNEYWDEMEASMSATEAAEAAASEEADAEAITVAETEWLTPTSLPIPPESPTSSGTTIAILVILAVMILVVGWLAWQKRRQRREAG